MNNTLQQLQTLRLTGMAEALSQQIDQPNTYEELGFRERLELLVNSEATCRDNRKITRLLKQAKLRLNAQPADIDYRVQRDLHKDSIAQLLQLDWIRQHRNLLSRGPHRHRQDLPCLRPGRTRLRTRHLRALLPRQPPV